jgi:hypothetical protein
LGGAPRYAFGLLPADTYKSVPSVTERQAAVYLLVKFWKEEARENDVEQFHWINAGAYLSAADLMSIAREVW